jgi:ABC-type transport system involved in multi-copper enzyme maturation permease subunit
MIRVLRAELVKVVRRRVLMITAAAVVVFAIGGAAIVLMTAEPAATVTPGRGPTVEDLAQAGGGTQVFLTTASFTGFFVFVIFVGAFAIEFGRGTIRTMLLREPRRLRLLAGKMSGLLVFAAGVLAVTEAATWVAARLIAPSQDVATDGWVSLAGLGDGIVDFGAVLLWVTGYAVLGMTIAVLVRSVPVAFAVGIAWAGPIEHLLQDAWGSASSLFPGLLLEAFVAGGTPEVTALRAALTLVFYVGAAALIAGMSFARRDVTA